ncbi:hypothetical protein [Changpingibacter yushuensis]|uniref:hypothetical protein n=1 Tax=Changpingibacter yushuensis TaxID=2758440 RepID=UPI0015F737C8|nr:hypothetical protein [Changpingibacter yushuensis]
MRLRWAYAARTLAGPWVALAVIVLDVGVALLRGAPYLGEAVFTVRWMALAVWMISALVGAVAAVDSAHLAQPGRRHLSLATAGGRREFVWAALWAEVPAAVVHLLAILVLFGIGGAPHPFVGWFPVALAMAAQAASIMWFAALGSFVGRLTQPVVAGLLGAAGAYAASLIFTTVSSGGRGFHPLGDSGATISQVGLVWNTGFLWLQLTITLLTAGLLLLSRPRAAHGWLLPSPAIVAAGFVVVILLGASMKVPGNQMVPTAEEPTHCAGTDPTICVYGEHERNAAPDIATVRQLVNSAREAGYDALVPAQVVEASRSRNPGDPDSRTTAFGPIEQDPDDVSILIQEMLTPAWCPALSGNDAIPDHYWTDMENIVYTWSGQLGDATIFTGDEHTLSPEDISEILNRWAACDLGAT